MWNWRTRKSRPRSANLSVREPVEQLENRSLLAGNVVASLSGSHLTVIGDTADNVVEIAVFDNAVHLRGLSDTTINGGTAFFLVAANTDTTGNVLISLGAGNDTVSFVRNVRLGGNVSFIGSTGNDTFNSVNATFQHNLALLGNQGNDTVSIQDSSIAGELRVHTHQGDDLVSVTDHIQTGMMLILGGAGDDGISLNNVTASSVVGFNSGRGEDDVAIRNSRITGPLSVWTKASQDVVVLDDSTFTGQVGINTGSGNDSVGVRETNTFNGALHVMGGDSSRQGGSAGDAVELATANVFNAGRRIRSEELTTVSPGAAGRIDTATTGLLARATAADSAAANAAHTLTANATSARSEQSTGGVLITRDASVTISGSTTPGATVNLDTDADGSFDDGTAVADANGAYSATVVVTRRDLYTSDSTTNDQLTGLQTISLRSTVAGGTAANSSVTVDFVQNSVVRFVSNLGTYEVELFDNVAQNTVNNFLGYLGRYTNSVIHRSVDNFVVQGGGFTISNGVIDNVTTDAPIQNQFNAARPNITGTLSMALTGNAPPATGNDLNSGTSQWFINLRNNTTLDTATTSHTVFGRVIGNGMTVVNAIAAVNQTDLASQSGVSALNELPQRNTFTEFTRTLTGSVSTTAGSTTITGVGTRFTTELTSRDGNPGGSRSRIQINGQSFNVISIASDTTLTVEAAPTTTQTSQIARTDQFVDDNFVRFSSIAEILDQI
jgi:cyclophilin family peptidyl-prolyl cis-trans isomerase